MTKLRMLSLCSGIGCIDLAAQIAGIEIAGQVENDLFCQQVLAKHWPDVKRLADMKEVTGNEFGRIDIVAGGIPCQPFSKAGKRAGTKDDRHLWPFAFTIIQNAQPTWVVIENVDDFIAMAFDLVASDLESENYEVQAYVLPACAVEAPHERQRCFIVAHSNSQRREECNASTRGSESRFAARCADTRDAENTINSRCETAWDISYPQISRWQEPRWEQSADRTRRSSESDLQRLSQPRLGRNADGSTRGMDRYQWPALPGHRQHDWEPSRTITARLPHRNKRLKALGNGVVWQQIYPIFSAITHIENNDVETRRSEAM